MSKKSKIILIGKGSRTYAGAVVKNFKTGGRSTRIRQNKRA